MTILNEPSISDNLPVDETAPFLESQYLRHSDTTLERTGENRKAVSKVLGLWLNSTPLLIQLTLIAIYTGIFFLSAKKLCGTCSYRTEVLYSPARDSVMYEGKTIKALVNDSYNEYNGPPSPALDKAWSDLIAYANIQVTESELKKLGRTSVQLADGSGNYLGALDVYHQLHCLKYIRHYIHPEYYELGHTNVPNKEHINHCIDMLRQVIMCKADITLMTYSWLPDFPGPWPNFNVEHECVNWESIQEWSKSRSIDVFNPKYLQHPTLGFSYKHLKGLNPEEHV